MNSDDTRTSPTLLKRTADWRDEGQEKVSGVRKSVRYRCWTKERYLPPFHSARDAGSGVVRGATSAVLHPLLHLNASIVRSAMLPSRKPEGSGTESSVASNAVVGFTEVIWKRPAVVAAVNRLPASGPDTGPIELCKL